MGCGYILLITQTHLYVHQHRPSSLIGQESIAKDVNLHISTGACINDIR